MITDHRTQIREAARRLATRPLTARLPLVVAQIEEPARREARKPDWIEIRRQRFQGAVSFLRSKGLLVQVDNPDRLVRLYLISGSFHRFTADQVIARAERLGWEGIGQ